LKIGFFTECYHPIVNGVVASVDASREGLQNAGHQVACITPSVPHYEEAETDVIRLPSLALPTATGYRLTVPVSARALNARLRAPLDVAHAHSQFITGHLAARYARAYDIPLVFTYHTRLEFYAHYAPLGGRLARTLLAARTRAFAARADLVIAPTAAARGALLDIGVRTPVAVLASPIDVARFRAGRRREDLRARLGADRETRLVLVAGRLAPEKNVELVPAVLGALPAEYHVAFVGEGALRDRLASAALRGGVGARICFAGALAPADMPDVYASADVLLFPSISESQGLVLVEALAAGLPVVAADAPQTREVLDGAGFVTEARPEALAAAIRGAVEKNADRSAIQLASERFSIEGQTRRLLELYAAAGAGAGRERTYVRSTARTKGP
jgi:glycosyltransferase involved in cell wall biosynthesis